MSDDRAREDDRRREDERVIEWIRAALDMTEEWARIARSLVIVQRRLDDLDARIERLPTLPGESTR